MQYFFQTVRTEVADYLLAVPLPSGGVLVSALQYLLKFVGHLPSSPRYRRTATARAPISHLKGDPEQAAIPVMIKAERQPFYQVKKIWQGKRRGAIFQLP
jgi:hypothetical protein